jgi:putative ABC transport system ATP-binding protein
MSTSEIAVKCRGIQKKFHSEGSDVVALAGVDLNVMAGEMMLLAGPSGCGKTTLISVIAGILSFDSGSCEVFGQDFSTMNARKKLDFRAKNIGFIFQAFNLLPSLTIAENVAIPLIINGVNRSTALEKAMEMLAEVGLADRAKNKPNSLSGGQQQRVAIARALVHSPRLVVCDEPTSALDHSTGMRIMNMMQSLNKSLGITFIVVTHDARIFEYADRIAFMDDGNIATIDNRRDKAQTTSLTNEAH